MKQEEVLEIAKSVGSNGDGFGAHAIHITQLERFAAIIEKRTIERCAAVCEDEVGNTHYDQRMIVAYDCAAAIRKLGEQ